MTRRHIDIPDELWKWVAVEAAKQGKSKRQITVEALEAMKENEDFADLLRVRSMGVDLTEHMETAYNGPMRFEGESDADFMARVRKGDGTE